MLPALIARLDQLIGNQIDAILHHRRFQPLESAWRSLYQLVQACAGYGQVRIRLLDIHLDEIHRDTERALDLEYSELFHRIYSEEFDHPGGRPFGLLIGNYVIDVRREAQMATLRNFSHIAASAFAPFVCSAPATIFGVDRFADLVAVGRDGNLLQSGCRRAMQSLRELEQSRFLALAIPHVRLRPCWGHNPPFGGGIQYREQCRDYDDYLWGNAAFAVATVLASEFQNNGWFAQIDEAPRDIPVGGLISAPGNPVPIQGDVIFSCLPITDVIITDDAARELADSGFISISQCWNTRFGTFPAMPALHEATRLKHMLCASRIAHHLKVMMRDKIGSYTSAEDCERLISNWLRQYISASNSIDAATRARYPLAAACVDIGEQPSMPGHYRCTLSLRLHNDADGIESEIQLTTELIAQSHFAYHRNIHES